MIVYVHAYPPTVSEAALHCLTFSCYYCYTPVTKVCWNRRVCLSVCLGVVRYLLKEGRKSVFCAQSGMTVILGRYLLNRSVFCNQTCYGGVWHEVNYCLVYCCSCDSGVCMVSCCAPKVQRVWTKYSKCGEEGGYFFYLKKILFKGCLTSALCFSVRCNHTITCPCFKRVRTTES